jgi:PDZ domain-containing secreted protein
VRVRTRFLALGAALTLFGGLYASGTIPCAVLTLQPDCELLVTGGPVLDTAELVTVRGFNTPVRRPEGRLLATTIEVSEFTGFADWFEARRDSARGGGGALVPRAFFLPPGAALEDVAVEGRLRMVESQQQAGAQALLVLGLIPSPETPSAFWPADVRFATEGVGGPSAGLMLALAIVAALAPEDPTSGLVVAGTGAFAPDGRVTGVGGLEHKLRSVVGVPGRFPSTGRGIDAFLLPANDLAAARRVVLPADVLLVPIEDLAEALAALRALQEGRLPLGAELLAAA